MRYKYCPECGTKLVNKKAGDDGDVPFCEKCNQYWFDTFFDCVIVLTYNEFDEIVITRQEHLSNIYTSFTSGFMTPGESAEETAIREVKEELGIDIQNLEYAGTYWFEERQMLMHGFIGFTPKCDFILSEEVNSAQWISPLEAPKTMFPDRPGNAAHAILRKFLKKRNLPST